MTAGDGSSKKRGPGRPKGKGRGGHRIWIALRPGSTVQADKDFIEEHLDAVERRDALIAAAQIKQERESKTASPIFPEGSDEAPALTAQK